MKLPTGGTNEGVGRNLLSFSLSVVERRGDVNSARADVCDVSNMDGNPPVPDELEEIRGVIEDAEAVGNPKGTNPRCKLLRLRMVVETAC